VSLLPSVEQNLYIRHQWPCSCIDVKSCISCSLEQKMEPQNDFMMELSYRQRKGRAFSGWYGIMCVAFDL